MKIKNIIILILLTIIGFGSLQSQTVIGVLDKKAYNIGDRIEFTFKVPFDSKSQTLIVNKSNSDSLELQNTIIDTVTENNKQYLRYKQYYTSFISGKRNIGDGVFVKVGNSEDKYFAVLPTEIEILEYPIDTNKIEIKDIKPVLEEKFSFKEMLPIIYVLLAIIVIRVGLYFLIWYMKKRKLNIETPEIIKEEPQIPPHIKALQSLEDLSKKKLSEQNLQKQYYTEMTEIIWVYLEERFRIFASEMTSSEILSQVKLNNNISQNNYSLLEKIFTTSDLVKFAKYETNQMIDKNTLLEAKEFVINTKEEIESNESDK